MEKKIRVEIDWPDNCRAPIVIIKRGNETILILNYYDALSLCSDINKELADFLGEGE